MTVNYVQHAENLLWAEAKRRGRNPSDEQIRYYALLLLAMGRDTSTAAVHHAWAVGRNRDRPDHPDLVPFEDLSDDVVAHDVPHRDVIRAAAAQMFGAEKVAIIGSVYCVDLLTEAAQAEQAAGRQVIGLPHWSPEGPEAEAVAAYLPVIASADAVVLVTRPDGSLGPWATRELAYALGLGKRVRMAATAAERDYVQA